MRRARTLAAAFLAAWAMPAMSAPPVVGVLLFLEPKKAFMGEMLREELRILGHEEGRTLILEYRHANGDNGRFIPLARELVALRPAVIASPCGTALRAIRELDRKVPVVSSCADPNNYLGEVKSIRRPGGATTGTTLLAPESAGKRLELLRELRPGLSRVAILHNRIDDWGTYWRETERAAKGIGVVLLRLPPVDSIADVDAAFAHAALQKAEAVVAFPDATILFAAQRIASLAIRHRLLTIFDFGAFGEAGGLLTYGPTPRELAQSTARYVDQILKGARPADLPIIQPSRFELTINLKTARALGLAVPQSLLLRADRVIE